MTDLCFRCKNNTHSNWKEKCYCKHDKKEQVGFCRFFKLNKRIVFTKNNSDEC